MSILNDLVSHKRNVFCLPRQKTFLFAFCAKIGQNIGKSGFQTVDQPSGSPIFCFHGVKTVENAGVLFGVLYGNKERQKVSRRRDLNLKNRVVKPFFKDGQKRKSSEKLKKGRFESYRLTATVE